MMSKPVWVAVALTFALPATPSIAVAAPNAPVTGPGSGDRKILKSHKVGRPPRVPKATLPDGAARGQEDADSRRAVAGGPTAEERETPLDDPDLDALRDAERVLFPKPLRGISTGWRWEFQDREASTALAPPTGDGTRRGAVAGNHDAATAEWLASLTLPNLPVQLDRRVVKYLKFYRDSRRGRAIARNWTKKSGRYVPAMKAELARMGLPTDLVWLSLIESGHNPTIRSPAGAAGLWQFIPATGRMYGLTVDRWVDERLDPAASTRAAARFLRDLHQRFGSWELAMGAYNMGHAGMLRTVRKYNSNDYWALSRLEGALPWETSLYVPKIFAIAIVMNNKKAFGLHDVELDAAVSFDAVRVESAVGLQDVANASDASVATISEMNPQYLVGRTPPPTKGSPHRRWIVNVPPGQGSATAAALASERSGSAYRPYLVRFGDSVDIIAGNHGITANQLRSINRIDSAEQMKPGTVLLVPADSKLVEDHEEVVVVNPRGFRYGKRERVFYRVIEGDTVADVARAFEVTTEDLLAWNGMDSAAHLQSDMVLQAFVRPDLDLSAVRHVRAKETRLVESGSKEFVEYFEQQKGRRRIVVKARKGDTLSTIGKRYGLSAGMMERINRFSRRKKLRLGDRVIVYTKHAARTMSDAPKPLAAARPPRPDKLPQKKSASVSAAKSGSAAR